MPAHTLVPARFLLSLLAGASIAPAQAPVPLPATIDRGCGVQPVPGGLRATGTDWLASFTAAGVEFVPVLGDRAPHDLPLQLRPVSLRRGATDVTIDRAVAPVKIANEVEYARGAGRERFAALPDGLHWTWRFDHPVGGEGDLVVRCEVVSELAANVREDGSLRFALPGLGGVDIGTVTGIDANGCSAAGELRLDGDQLDLVLPAAFVDHASYPLVLDPVLSTFAIDTAGNIASDVAYDVGTDRWLAVWSRSISATSTLVHGRLLLGDGTPTGAVFQCLPVTNVHQGAPSVASMRSAGAFLVAWQQSIGSSNVQPYRLRGTLIDANAGPTLLPFVLGANPAGPSEVMSRMCSDNDTDGSHDVQIVWNAAGAGIRGTLFHLDPLGAYSATVSTLSTDATDARPVISRSQRGDTAHLVAWRRTSGVAAAVHGAMFSRTFVPVGAERALTTAVAGINVNAFDVDGDGANFGLTWYAIPPSGQAMVSARPVDWNGLLIVPGTEQTLTSQSPIGGTGPSYIGRFGPKLLVAWSAPNTLTPFGSVVGRDLSPGCTSCGSGWGIPALVAASAPSRFASRIAGGGTSPDGLLVLSQSTFSGTELHGARVAAFGAGGAITPVGASCGVAGTIATAGGPFALGNPDFVFTLAGAPAGAVPFLSLGFPGNEIGCGGCVLTNAIALAFRPLSGGAAVYPWSLPCNVAFVGVNFSAQWVLFVGGAAACPAAPGLVATSRLEVTLGQ